MPIGDDYVGGQYLGESYDNYDTISGIFPPYPARSFSNVQSPNPPLQTIPYVREAPLFVVKQREIWSEIDLQRFHDETLQTFGEQCVVRLLWRAEDFTAGLVGRCIVCQDSESPTNPDVSVQQRVAKVYGQSGNTYCPNCYGTSFNGGFIPIAYHLFMLAADTPDKRNNQVVGQFWNQNPRVQFSWFPQIRQGDLVARVESWSENTPILTAQIFMVSNVEPVTLRSGPGPSAEYPYRTGTQPFKDTTKIVSQICTLENLQPGHPYFSVPLA
jgi:hypothetical protein